MRTGKDGAVVGNEHVHERLAAGCGRAERPLGQEQGGKYGRQLVWLPDVEAMVVQQLHACVQHVHRRLVHLHDAPHTPGCQSAILHCLAGQEEQHTCMQACSSGLPPCIESQKYCSHCLARDSPEHGNIMADFFNRMHGQRAHVDENLLQHAQELGALQVGGSLQHGTAQLAADERLRQAAEPQLQGAGELQGAHTEFVQ